jgi:hypothetical protein
MDGLYGLRHRLIRYEKIYTRISTRSVGRRTEMRRAMRQRNVGDSRKAMPGGGCSTREENRPARGAICAIAAMKLPPSRRMCIDRSR